MNLFLHIRRFVPLIILLIKFLPLSLSAASIELQAAPTTNDNNNDQFELFSTFLVPKHFLNLLYRDCQSCYVFVVEHDTQKAYLMKFEKDPYDLQIIRDFEISTGKQKGSKRSEWDLRTPSGYYEITSFRPAHTLQEKFGPGAYVLNYPNALEKMEKRTGSGIWIHGTDRIDFIDYDSEGCVRLKNDELPILENYLKPYQTPVIIVKQIEWIAIHRLIEEKQAFSKRLNDWLTSWQNNSLDEFLSFYDPSFYASGLNKDIVRWIEYKRDIFSDNPTPSINLNEKKIIFRNDTILVQGKQHYKSASYSDIGIKTLIWEKNKDNWYITLEHWKAD